jgi:hypothetical protein
MNAIVDNPSAAQFFAELNTIDEVPRNSWAARARREETKTEMLAHEIVRYAPSLATKLAVAGRKRMAMESH